MDESNSTITGVMNLMRQMQQAVQAGEIELSRQEWAQIYDFLAEYEGLLEDEDVSEPELENVAWEVVEAFEENETLSTHFRATLDQLQDDTSLSGNWPGKSEREKMFLRNTIIYLSFIQQAKEEGTKKSPKASEKPS